MNWNKRSKKSRKKRELLDAHTTEEYELLLISHTAVSIIPCGSVKTDVDRRV